MLEGGDGGCGDFCGDSARRKVPFVAVLCANCLSIVGEGEGENAIIVRT